MNCKSKIEFVLNEIKKLGLNGVLNEEKDALTIFVKDESQLEAFTEFTSSNLKEKFALHQAIPG